MSTGLIRLINDSVKPRIVTLCATAQSSRAYTTLTYYEEDSDGSLHKLDASSLTIAERGYFLRYKPDLIPSRVLVTIPYIVVDRVIGELLRGLKSFRISGECILDNSKLSKYPSNALHNFTLVQVDLDKLIARCKQSGIHIEKDSVTLEEIKSLCLSLDKDIAQLNVSLANLVEQADSKLVENLEESIARVEECVGLSGVLSERSLYISKRVDILSRDTNSLVLIANGIFKPRLEEVNKLRVFNYERLTRQLGHAYSVANSLIDENSKPSYVTSLGAELAELSKYFPVLRHLTVVNDNLVEVRLALAKVKLTSGAVSIDGSIDSLKKFTEATVKENAKGSRFDNLELNSVPECTV